MQRMLLLAMLLPLCGLAPSAAAQDEIDARLRAIEQGYEDLSPQAESLRLYPVDMRVPFGFSTVYEIVDAPGLLARRAGSVTAVFERSVYEADSTVAIPPGTVFYVGDLPVDLGRPGVLAPASRPAGREPAWNFVDTSAGRGQTRPIDLRVPRVAVPPTGAPSGRSPATVWASEPARQARVGEILRGVAWKLRESRAQEAPDGDTTERAGEDPERRERPGERGL